MLRAALVSCLCVIALACSEGAPDPTEPIEVPLFVDEQASFSRDHDEGRGRGGIFGTGMSGREEVPVRETRARGIALFIPSRHGDHLHYLLGVSNISNVVAAHIHVGPSGMNGPVSVWLYPSTTPGGALPGGGPIHGIIAHGIIDGDDVAGPLAGQGLDGLLAAMRAGNTYVNVHTNDGVGDPNTGPGDFPGGEIRGQIRHHGRH